MLSLHGINTRCARLKQSSGRHTRYRTASWAVTETHQLVIDHPHTGARLMELDIDVR